MGAAASTAISMPVFDRLVMPKHGVKLSFFDEFVNSCGGRTELTGLTTTDVKDKFVLKWTEQYKCSFNDLLREMKHPSYNEQADVFISHAWKYEFLKVVDILKHHFTNRPSVVIWFDLFSNNQHEATGLEYGWWATTFRSAISEFGHTVMVLMPWDDPIPLKRAWCLFELYCTHDTGCKFEVAMGDSGYEEFAAAMDQANAHEVVNKMLSNIDVHKSEAFKPEDKAMIHSTVERDVHGGLMKLNAVVLTLMRDWVITVAEEEMRKRKALLGDSHPDTLRSLSNLAALYNNQGKYDQAEPMYVECVERRKTILGDLHPDTLQSLNDLAALYKNQGKYDTAEALYAECIEKRKPTSGDSHPDTLQSLNNLAALYKNQGKYSLAEPLYIETLEKRKVILGDSHPDTLQSLNNLAILYRNQGKYELAEPLYLESLDKRTVVLGDSHPDTLESLNNLAVLYLSVGKYDQAEKFY
jgi:tetratricopeptide (TPR) repeat protein